MIINNVKYDFSELQLPPFDVALAACQEKVLSLANGNIMFLYPALDKLETESGIKIPDTVKMEVQKIIQQEGGMLVDMCPSLKDNIQVKHFYGDKLYVKVIASEYDLKHGFKVEIKGRTYEVLVMPASTIVCQVKKPTYDTDVKVSNKPKHKASNLTV